jgi:membrane-associated protease RseP (regulator of RpoE activity)
MLAVGVPPHRCTLGAFGMRIDLRNTLVGYGSHIAISLAGPLANGVAAVVLFLLRSPQAAMVHLLLAGVNLLPAAALDGGELLYYGLCLLGMEHLADSLLRFTSALVLLPLAAVSIWLFIENRNPTLLIVSGYLVTLIIFSEKNEKTS